MRTSLVVLLSLLVIVGASFAGDITATGMFQGDLYTYLSNTVTNINANATRVNLLENERTRLCGILPIAKIGTSDTGSVDFTSDIFYMIDGAMYITGEVETVMAGGTQAVSTFRNYLVSIDTDGTITVTAGTAAATNAAALAPALPSGECAVAMVKVATDGSTTFVPGASDATGGLDQGGLTVTYYDLPGPYWEAQTDLGTSLSLTGL